MTGRPSQLYSLAGDFEDEGRPDLAANLYQALIDKFPDDPYTAKAIDKKDAVRAAAQQQQQAQAAQQQQAAQAAAQLEMQKEQAKMQAMIAPYAVALPTLATARCYARIRAELEKRGQSISEQDLWVAATALEEGGTVVTNNVAEFARIPGLAVEDWY